MASVSANLSLVLCIIYLVMGSLFVKLRLWSPFVDITEEIYTMVMRLSDETLPFPDTHTGNRRV